MKYDSIGLTVEGALRLTRQIREAETKREEAEARRKRQLEALRDAIKILLETEEYVENARRQESLLKNRRSLLVRRGLKSLKVEPDDPSTVSGASVSKRILTQNPVLDPSLFTDLPS